MITSSIRRLFGKSPSSSTGRARHRPPRATRFVIDVLETRALLCDVAGASEAAVIPVEPVVPASPPIEVGAPCAGEQPLSSTSEPSGAPTSGYGGCMWFPFSAVQAGDGQGGLSHAIAVDGSVETIVGLPVVGGQQLTWSDITYRVDTKQMTIVDLGSGQQVFSGAVSVFVDPSPNVPNATNVKVRAFVATTINVNPGWYMVSINVSASYSYTGPGGTPTTAPLACFMGSQFVMVTP